MAIINHDTGEVRCKGAVVKLTEHYWLDGMLEEYAETWDIENHEWKTISYGYYGSDCRNLNGHVTAEIDFTSEIARDIIRTVKAEARKAFERSVLEYKSEVHKGYRAEVTKGRKVKKGTLLEVFWVGEKPTYRAMHSEPWSWYHSETEKIAGCYDSDGNKVWIKAEYLKCIDPIKSPNAKERDKFIKSYIKNNTSYEVQRKARETA